MPISEKEVICSIIQLQSYRTTGLISGTAHARPRRPDRSHSANVPHATTTKRSTECTIVHHVKLSKDGVGKGLGKVASKGVVASRWAALVRRITVDR